MKIQFDKVGYTPKAFSFLVSNTKIEGLLERKSSHSVELKADISGKVSLDCDRCGNSYNQNVDEAIRLCLTDEISQDKEDLDIIEFLDGVVDISYILDSELNAIAQDYHFCPKCADDDNILEIEF